ncbi:VWA domain-containing protein [bacterium]|nr:VWA domain-containing protein [bacterium]
MPDIENTETIARKLLPIIYVLDTSGSMEGDRIAAVNLAMSETMEVLKDVSKNNPSAELKIGVLKFDSGSQWITDSGFVFMEDFFWNDLKAGGLTDLGSALKELDDKMSRKKFLNSEVGYKVPVLIFMSDGQPTDDYKSALKKINASNKWFKASTKIAIAVGDDADTEVLKEIVGNSEAVIRVNDLETLKRLIKVASVTASMIGSKSRTDSDAQSEILNSIQQDAGVKLDKSDDVSPKPAPAPDPEPDTFDADDPWGDDKWD